jgi:hypothetical protein
MKHLESAYILMKIRAYLSFCHLHACPYVSEMTQICYLNYYAFLSSPNLGRVPVTTAWRTLGLRMEVRPPDMEGSCEYTE